MRSSKEEAELQKLEDEVDELWKIIHERLSPSDMKTCESILDAYKFHINRDQSEQLHKSLLNLFKKDEFLYQRFTQVFPCRDNYEKEDQEDKDGKMAMENLEVFVRRVRRRRRRRGDKKLTKQEKAMANCEDEIFEADMLIESARIAVGRAEEVMSGEMRLEDLGSKFYDCIKKLLRRNTVDEYTFPRILNRLKKKLEELIVERESKKPEWKKVFEENSEKKRDSSAKGYRKK